MCDEDWRVPAVLADASAAQNRQAWRLPESHAQVFCETVREERLTLIAVERDHADPWCGGRSERVAP